MLGVDTEMQTVEGGMATVNSEALDVLNALLEDQRASVEIDVALAMGATERVERDTLTVMGSEDVLACITLREHLEAANVPVTQHINGIVLAVLATETYDDRLRAFVELHAEICNRVSELLPLTEDDELRTLLREMYDQHQRNAEWCAQRAGAFDFSRTLDFRAPRQSQAGDELRKDEPLWEPLDPRPEPEPHRDAEAQEIETSHLPTQQNSWQGEDATDEPYTTESSGAWQDDDPPNRRSRFLRSNEARIDGR